MKFIIGMIVFNTGFWISLHLGIGYLITRYAPTSAFDYRKSWYREHFFERKLYRFLRVKRWKSLMPTYGSFNKKNLPAKITRDYLAQFIEETCYAEIIHWGIGLAGFSSITFTLFTEAPIEYLWLFLGIAVVMFFSQMPFIAIQRYNRPRLIRLSSGKGQ